MIMPMQLIFGLGNPGEKYQSSRHNMGFVVVEEIDRQLHQDADQNPEHAWHMQPKFQALVCKKDDLILVKPQTFMNRSGQAVRAIISYYDKQATFTIQSKFPQLWVIHDDLDLVVGQYKIQFGTGPKVHNGLASVDEQLHTQNYWHVRIGVDGRNGDRSIPPQDYVLSGFKPDEKVLIDGVIKEVSSEVLRRLEVSSS